MLLRDMLRAAREVDPHIGKRYVVMGHSQGGQVDLFAAAIGPGYVPEFKLLGDVAFAPGAIVAAQLENLIKSPKNEPGLPFALYALQSYAQANKAIDLRKILTPEALARLPDLHQGCLMRLYAPGYWSTVIAKDMFVAKPDLRAFLAMVKRNYPGSVHIAVPTALIQGTSDVTVPPESTDEVARRLCRGGNRLLYVPVAGVDHTGVMDKGGVEAQSWIDARFRGEKAATNCKALPKAGR